MKLLSVGHFNALFKDAEKPAWTGKPCYFSKGSEIVPFIIDENKLVVEFVIPEHIQDPQQSPVFFVGGINEHFLMPRDYRLLKINKVNDSGFMDIIRDDDLLFSKPEMAPLYISCVQEAVCKFVKSTPGVNAFIFEGKGKHNQLVRNTLTKENHDLSEYFEVKNSTQLSDAYSYFEIMLKN